MSLRMLASLAIVSAGSLTAQAEDWNQWRGPGRDGSSGSSVRLIESIPDDGIPPVWVSTEPLAGGGNGGWSSPIIAGGRVYCFSHSHKAREGVKLDPEKYPGLKDEQREAMSKDEIAEYEAKRNVEQKERRDRQYRYEERLLALDAASGKLVWSHERESVPTGFGQSGTPVIARDRLYYLGADRTLVCLKVDSGAEAWKTPLPVAKSEEQISSSVALADGVAIVLAGDLVGVDAQSGKFLWKSAKGRMTGMESSPVVWESEGRTRVVVNVNGSDTVCVDPRSGEEIWRVQSHAGRSTPVIVGDRMVTLGDNRKNGLRCFDLSVDGAELTWSYQGICDPGSSPVVVEGKVYVQGENRLACIDLETGKPSWRTTLDMAQPRYTSLIASDRKVFYVFEGVLAFAADPEEHRVLIDARMNKEGRLAPAEHFRKALGIAQIESKPNGQEEAQRKWQREIGQHGPLACTSPAIADGKLYVRRNSSIVCYDLSQSSRLKPNGVSASE